MPTLPLEGREHKVFVIVPFRKPPTGQLSLQKEENTRSLLLCLLENHTHANSPSRRKRTQGLCYCAFQKTIHMPTLPLEGREHKVFVIVPFRKPHTGQLSLQKEENTRSLLLCLLENKIHANSPSRRKRTQDLYYCAFQKTIHMPTLPLEGREHKVFVIVPFRKPHTGQLSLQKEENTRSLLLCLLENHTHANSPSRRKRTQDLCYCAFQKTIHRPTLPLEGREHKIFVIVPFRKQNTCQLSLQKEENIRFLLLCLLENHTQANSPSRRKRTQGFCYCAFQKTRHMPTLPLEGREHKVFVIVPFRKPYTCQLSLQKEENTSFCYCAFQKTRHMPTLPLEGREHKVFVIVPFRKPYTCQLSLQKEENTRSLLLCLLENKIHANSPSRRKRTQGLCYCAFQKTKYMPTLPLEGREHKVFVIVPFRKPYTCQLSLQKDENTRSLLLCLLENKIHANSPSRRQRTQGLCYCAFQKSIHRPTLPLEGREHKIFIIVPFRKPHTGQLSLQKEENTRSLLLCLLENQTQANSPSRRKRTQDLYYCAFQKTIHRPTLPLEGREHKVFVIVPFRKQNTCQLSLQKEENTRSLLLCLLENHTHANSPSRRTRTQGLCYCAFQKTTHMPTLPLEGREHKVFVIVPFRKPYTCQLSLQKEENIRFLLLCLLENQTHANSPSRRKRTQDLCYCSFQKTTHMPTLPLEGREHKVFVIVPFRKPHTGQLSLYKEENIRFLLLCLL